jgi:hypothetical protein
LKKFCDSVDNVFFNEQEDTMIGEPSSIKIKEDLKFMTAPCMQNYIKWSDSEEAITSEDIGSYEKVFTTLHGKREILTSRILAHNYFQDYIYFFDIFSQRTFYLPLDPLKHFIGFFNQIEEDNRKISYA